MILCTSANLSGHLSPAFYNYALIYSFIEHMYPPSLKYASILFIKLFWVTGKEATCMDW